MKTNFKEENNCFVLIGSKNWITNAPIADIFIIWALNDAAEIQGFIIEKNTRGLSTSLIANKTSLKISPTGQIILNNVKIPKDSLIGELNRGWYIAATLLDFERSGVEYPSSAKRNFEEIIQFVKKNKNSSGEPLIKDPYINKTIVELDLDIEAARLMAYEVAYLQSQGEVPSIEGSVAKILGTTLTQKIAKIGTDFSGLYGQLTDSSAPFDGKYLKQQLHVTAFTIFAGTTEIQKNIIATRGLGLPREDKLTVKK